VTGNRKLSPRSRRRVGFAEAWVVAGLCKGANHLDPWALAGGSRCDRCLRWSDRRKSPTA